MDRSLNEYQDGSYGIEPNEFEFEIAESDEPDCTDIPPNLRSQADSMPL